MIPNIEEILQQVREGTMSTMEAAALIERHAQLDVDNAIAQYEDEYDEAAADDDCTRTQLLASVIRTIPPGAQSDSAAIYCWDVVARIMDMRERGIGKITAQMANELREPPPPAPESLEAKVARLEKELQRNPAANPFNPAVHKGPWTAKEAVVGDLGAVGAVQTWGDGSEYPTSGEVLKDEDGKPLDHDDGPY